MIREHRLTKDNKYLIWSWTNREIVHCLWDFGPEIRKGQIELGMVSSNPDVTELGLYILETCMMR